MMTAAIREAILQRRPFATVCFVRHEHGIGLYRGGLLGLLHR